MTQTITLTQLQEMIVPDVWAKYIIQESTVNTDFWQSGILSDLTPVVGGLLGEGGTTVNLPFFNDIDGDDEIIDDTQNMSVGNITTGQDLATVIMRAKAWGVTDLAGELSGEDPLAAISSLIGKYWARRMQVILLAICQGAMGSLAAEAATASNHFIASPNNLDISAATGNAGVFDAFSFMDAKYKLGDKSSQLSALAVHSDTKKLMEKQDLIDYIQPSTGGNPVATYQGKLIIETDQMPVVNGVYTTYLFGPGAVGYAEGSVEYPVEAYRQMLENFGRTLIGNRRKFALHIRGVKWIGNPAQPTVSNTELANPANWQRVYDPKNVRLVRFTHRNA
jgi:hypothetical protein